jgi:hypothetical protein
MPIHRCAADCCYQRGKGGPAEGIFQVGDVILGVGGNPFSYDAGTKLGQAVSVAKTELGAGKWP